MAQTKRQRQNSIDDDNKKKKSIIDLDSSSKTRITYLEDLSNEIIYEVFEYLDYCRIYEAFFDLNIRFENLLTHIHLYLPIKIDLSFILKPTFQRYYINILTPYQHQIKSLHSSSSYITDRIFLSLDTSLKFTRLEKLTLDNITLLLLEKVLTHLISLSYLFSLDINCIDGVQDQSKFYDQIFRLPVLKYCKLSCKYYVSYGSLPIARIKFSPIEYLIITYNLRLHEINALLSYVPQLRRLSLDCEDEWFRTEIVSYSIILNHLTHVYLNINGLTFDHVESMIKNLFHQIQVLGISTQNNKTCFDANRWQRLILNNLPYLRIFDIAIGCYLPSDDDMVTLIDQFNSSFWIERQWFFEHQISKGQYRNGIFLHSTNPYRIKHFTLYEESDENTNPNNQKCNVDSVDLVNIFHEKAMINCRHYFPNANRLNISYESVHENFYSTNLSLIIPLERLTALNINHYYGHFSDIIELLRYTPNIHTLSIIFIPYYNTNSVLFEENESFRLVSKTNNIKKVSIASKNIFKMTKFIVMLCPRLEHLTINELHNSLKPVLQFLLSTDNHNTCYLSSLWGCSQMTSSLGEGGGGGQLA